MHRLAYRITTFSPVLITTNVGDTNMVATSEYIPGSSVLGLFAGKFIQEKSLGSDAHKDDTFYNWFLKGDLRFTNAYIVSREEDDKIKKNWPVPLSLQHEKGDETDVYDLLVDEDFDKQTSIIGGFGRIEGKSLYKQDVKKALNFHHRRDSQTGTSKEGMIFNYESIDANQTFEGCILGNGKDLQGFLELFSKEDIAYIGRSKNAQYGKVSLEIVSQSPEAFISEIDGTKTGNGEISLTLLSNTVIYNDYGFSTTDLIELENVLKKDLGSGIRIKKAFIRTGDVENFVSVWRLKKPSESGFLAGSCFLIEIDEEISDDKLLGLQKEGIGERRNEGFGEIAFGWQKEDSLTMRDPVTEKVKRPERNIPSKTKEIVIKVVVKDFIYKQVELKALNKVKEFVREGQKNKGLPSKSLIGRLESMVRRRGKMDLENLRKTAKDQLEHCKSDTQTLLDFLSELDSKNMLAKVFSKPGNGNLKKLCNEKGIKFSPEGDTGYVQNLYCTYLLTFFSAMRRILKKGGD